MVQSTNVPTFITFLVKDSNAGKSSNVAGQAFSSGELGHFYAIICIRAFCKTQHNNLITLMNKVRIDIRRRQ